MTTFRVPLPDLGKYEASLAKRIIPSVVRELRRAAPAVLGVLRARTQDAPPTTPGGRNGVYASGSYMRAWQSENIEGGVRVFNDSPHAVFVEYGRRPGKMPPIDAIVTWLRVRGFKPRGAEASTGRRRGRKGLFLKDGLRGVAFLIARAIGKRGMRGRFVLTRAAPWITQIAERAVNLGADKALEAARRG